MKKMLECGITAFVVLLNTCDAANDKKDSAEDILKIGEQLKEGDGDSKNDSRIFSNESDELNISVYNGGLALVKDSRKVLLKKGLNILEISDVSCALIVNSVNVKAYGDLPVKILSHEIIKSNSSSEGILRNFIGKNISYINKNKNQECSGILEDVSFDNTSKQTIAVIKSGEMLDILPTNDCLAFSVSSRLKKDALRVYLYSEKDVRAILELSYVTEGLSWSPEYLIEISSNLDKATILSNAMLKNNTEWNIKNANVVFDHYTPLDQDKDKIKDNELLCYIYPEKLSLKKMSSAIVALDSKIDHETERSYLIKIPDVSSSSISQSTVFPLDVNKLVLIKYADSRGNVKNHNDLFLFSVNGGNKKFLGRRNSSILPVGASDGYDMSFVMGIADDIDAIMRYTDVRKISEKITEISVMLEINNKTNHDITTYIIADIQHKWEIIKENVSRKSINNPIWNICINANSTKELYYRFRIFR